MVSFGQKGYGTLEPNNATQEEQISFTGITQNANGTATLTGVKTVLFKTPFTETSAVTKAHPGGSKFIVSNTSAYQNTLANKLNTESITGVWIFDAVTGIPQLSVDHKYAAGDELKLITYAALQSVSFAGVSDMSITAKGIGEEATQAEIDAGTQAGATSAQLVVNPKYLKDSIYYTQLPSSDEKAALAGTSGTPSAANKFVTADGAVTTAFGGALKSTAITGLYIASQAKGDLIYKSTGNGWTRLGTGTSGQKLQTNGTGTAPTWANTLTHAFGNATYAGDTSSGNQVIAHGLGKTPIYVRLTMRKYVSSGNQCYADGVGDGSSVAGVWTRDSSSPDAGSGMTISETAGSQNITGITLDATNITITWTKSSTPNSNNIQIMYEVWA